MTSFATGTRIRPPAQTPLVRPVGLPTLDARGAMAEALAAYLQCIEFVRWGGLDGVDVPFKLKQVLEEWPEPDRTLVYPSASVVEATTPQYQAHSFVPNPLEDTLDLVKPNTVLWKTGEARADFQVDFWANDVGTREAIAAQLPRAFAPGELANVLLQGSARYFARPVRARLVGLPRRMDDATTIYPRERRLMATVQCEVDVVDLRCAILGSPRVDLNEIGEQVELEQVPDVPTTRPDCEDRS